MQHRIYLLTALEDLPRPLMSLLITIYGRGVLKGGGGMNEWLYGLADF